MARVRPAQDVAVLAKAEPETIRFFVGVRQAMQLSRQIDDPPRSAFAAKTPREGPYIAGRQIRDVACHDRQRGPSSRWRQSN